ncbi:terminase large subunit [Sinorhizobium medicae]|nr:terminase large subunit [Sinorhizobium medicae]
MFVGRKNGKTTLISGVSLYGVSKDNESGADIPLLANSMKQARLIFDEAKAMIKSSPKLKKRFRPLRDAIHFDKTFSKIEPQASDSEKLDGLNTHIGVFDEIHEYKTFKLINVVKNSRASRDQPLLIYITTAGYQLDGPLIEYYKQADDVLKGVITDERTFYYMAELDSEEEFEMPEMWGKANPNIGVSIKLQDMIEEWEKAKRIPSERNDFITKRFNKFVNNSEESFLDYETLKKNDKEVYLGDIAHIPCIGGFDLSDSEDFTSACLEFPLVDTGQVVVLSHSWVPYKKVIMENENIPYYELQEEGLLTIVHDEYIRKNLIFDWFVKQSERFNIEMITYDRAKATELVENLTGYGFDTKMVIQGHITLGPAVDDVKERFLDGNVIFNNNRLFRWYINNVKMVEDRNRNKLPTKIGRYRKIDGFAAFLNAHTEVMKKFVQPAGEGNIEFISINDL